VINPRGSPHLLAEVIEMRAYALWIVAALGAAACTTDVPTGADGTGHSQGALGSLGAAPLTDGTCDPRLVACANVCIDPLGDPTNCGGCGVACGAGETCNGGTCVSSSTSTPDDAGTASSDAGNPVTCGVRLVLCGSACVDPLGDPQNCGGCGVGCGAQESCNAGQCVADVVTGDDGGSVDPGVDAGR
jgi:hypothetical protein